MLNGLLGPLVRAWADLPFSAQSLSVGQDHEWQRDAPVSFPQYPTSSLYELPGGRGRGGDPGIVNARDVDDSSRPRMARTIAPFCSNSARPTSASPAMCLWYSNEYRPRRVEMRPKATRLNH